VVSLEEGLSVSGTVVGKSGELVPDAMIYLLALDSGVAEETADEDDERPRDRLRRERQRRRVEPSAQEAAMAAFASLREARASAQGQRVNDDGSFKLVEVPAGRYLLIVDHEGYLPIGREIFVGDGALADHRLVLDPGETLTGTITLDREPGAGLSITVRSGGVFRRAETDLQGRYFVSGLLPGSYAVSVSLGTESIAPSLTATVEEGKTNEFDYQHETK
jgi:hypothetical protein